MVVPRRATTWLASVAAGLIIGAVESVLAIAFAALVFGGLLAARLPDGIGLYLGAAALTLAFMAWRSGSRGVVGSVQDAAAAVLGLVASAAAAKAADLDLIARQSGLEVHGRPDIFLTVVAATLVVTVLCGILFSVIGRVRLGALIRFVPYPVVGGFLAGTGWLLFKGGIYVATGTILHLRTVPSMIREYQLAHWLPALAFGVILLISVRVVKRPLVIPAVIAIGLGVFVAGMVATGSSIEEVREGGWLLFGSSETAQPWKPWAFRALGGADWSSVLESWAGIVTAVFVATFAILFNISGTELVLDRDLDTNEELRDAGVLNVVSGALGGIPGYHALSLTALAERMRVDARAAGLIAALVPLAAVVVGAEVVGLIPRMIVGGVLVFLGLSFMVEWVWDKRRLLPPLEYAVVVVILLGIIVWGFLVGVVIGLVLAVLLFAISYGRIELVREVAFGETYRSNVDRPATERAELRGLSERVQILRVSGFVFFGSTNRLLERIRRRMEGATPPRFLVIDLRRVTGVDSSAVVSFVKVMRLAEASGSEIVFTAASDPVRAQLARGGVVESDGLVAFEPDLDRGLQRCEDALLSAPGLTEAQADHPAGRLDGLPPGLDAHLERVSVPEGTVLLHQDDPPGDIYVLESGRLGVETTTPEGSRIRLRTLRPGVVVGEITLYTGIARTADVVAEVPSVVLRIGRESIERLEAEEPELAATLHRWLATTLAERLTDTRGAVDALLD
ncbi:MAG TPA: SulP family inorganic anion transporter [Actinomycetota bacterium]|nr:SulP family inorganic anion transporter [Actinomycetota bacterium]